MVTQTVEAIYENGKIKLMGDIKSERAKLYIVVIEELDIEPIRGSTDFIGTKLHKKGLELINVT